MRAPLHGVRALTCVLLGALGAAGCADRATFAVGDQCVLNSDCASPLVCRLGRCRIDCRDSRDCGAGLVCLYDSTTQAGGCQIDDEGKCTLNSDCPAPLVCRYATCTTQCANDTDCAPGATCELQDGGVGVCHEPQPALCVYNSDCPVGMVCGAGQFCYVQCFADVDCTAPRTCDLTTHRCVWYGDAGTP